MMNNFIFSLGFYALMTTVISAQNDSLITPKISRWSIHVSGGYGFPFAQEYLGYSEHQYTQNNTTYTSFKASIGNGILSTTTVSYLIKERMGLEIGAFMNRGTECHLYRYSSDVFPDIFNDRYSYANTQGALIGFFLSQKFSKVEIGLHNYFLCSFGNKGYERERRGDDNDEFITVIENTGGIGFGWLNKLSFEYKISPKISAGVEGFLLLQTWSPKQGEFIEKSYNGVNGAANIPDNDRIFTYPVTHSNAITNPYIYASAFTYPLHSCGVSLRISYSF